MSPNAWFADTIALPLQEGVLAALSFGTTLGTAVDESAPSIRQLTLTAGDTARHLAYDRRACAALFVLSLGYAAAATIIAYVIARAAHGGLGLTRVDANAVGGAAADNPVTDALVETEEDERMDAAYYSGSVGDALRTHAVPPRWWHTVLASLERALGTPRSVGLSMAALLVGGGLVPAVVPLPGVDIAALILLALLRVPASILGSCAVVGALLRPYVFLTLRVWLLEAREADGGGHHHHWSWFRPAATATWTGVGHRLVRVALEALTAAMDLTRWGAADGFVHERGHEPLYVRTLSCACLVVAVVAYFAGTSRAAHRELTRQKLVPSWC